MVDNLKNMYFQIAPSGTHGVGLVAFRSIPKGTLLFKVNNDNVKYYTYKELRERGIPQSVIKVIKKYYAHDKKGIEIPDNYFSEINFTIVSYINHSDSPNVLFIPNTNSYISRKRIKKDEELTISYKENNYCPQCVDFKIKNK